MTGKTNLLGMTQTELEAFARNLGQPKYRGRQIYQWIYARRATSFAEMTNLSKPFRDELEACARVGYPELAGQQVSDGGATRKFLLNLDDSQQIESVFMSEGERRTLCISSQVGCPLKCSFCATGRMGLVRDLTPGEIVGQVLFAVREMKTELTNIVLMGMGEPLLNYDNVIQACNLLGDEEGINLARRGIVISTSGIVPAIRRFADEGHSFKLAVSLNAANDELRTRIMPHNAKYNLAALKDAVKYYAGKAKERVTFEYVLMAGVNDSPGHASELKRLVRGMEAKVNLIPYNAVSEDLLRPTPEQVNDFARLLAGMRPPVTVRWSKGADIDAGCGQLWTKSKRKHRQKNTAPVTDPNPD